MSDLYGCYRDLLNGVAPKDLARRHIRIEVLAAQELYAKGVTLEELKRFQEHRAASIAAAGSHEPLECSCGFALFDDEEYKRHVRLNPDPSRESILQEPAKHTLRSARL